MELSKICNFGVRRGESGIKTLEYEKVKKATFHKVTVEKSNIPIRCMV
jgi:hypothetical protein